MRTAPVDSVVICECAARDGLQHEERFVPTQDKVAMIRRFASAGFKRIEATSFSHPKHVPQFADAEAVLKSLADLDDVSLKATCVNDVAVRRAVAACDEGWGPDEISLVVSASEVHSKQTTRRDHDAIEDEIRRSAPLAMDAGLSVGGTIGTAFGCPFTGAVSDGQVAKWVEVFTSVGIEFVSLGDTTGMADPWDVKRRLELLKSQFPSVAWGVHFHDSRGLAIANCAAAMEVGVTSLDSAFGGLGGFPAGHVYARGHTGNACTEDLVAFLEAAGVNTGVDLENLFETAKFVETVIGRTLESRVLRSGTIDDLLSYEELSTPG
jgi:hydroxymethylglutaryl-CoA lyase